MPKALSVTIVVEIDVPGGRLINRSGDLAKYFSDGPPPFAPTYSRTIACTFG